jgi:hypothetical protein
MHGFTEFVRGVVEAGSARLRQLPRFSCEERGPVLTLLESAFRHHRLTVAGPAIHFDAEAALAACEFTARACWYLLHRDEAPSEAERALALPPPPQTPAEHLSADVLFRLLPAVHRRARSLDAGDVLTTRLADLFRAWPLSGVLSDLDEGPSPPLDFGSHRGLCLLYAERLAVNPRPGWVVEGAVREYIELVFDEKGMRGLP